MTGLSAHQIYLGLTGGQGASSLARAFHTAKAEANLEIERADRINQLARKLEAGWEGEAGAAAFGAAQPLAEVSKAGATNLERTHLLLEQQVDLFDYARVRVKPVPPNPPETNLLDDLAPWSTDNEDKGAKYKADSNYNVELYRQYDMQSYDNEMSLPTEYPEIVDPGGDIKVERPTEPPRPPGGPGERDEVTPPPGDRDRVDPPTPPPDSRDEDTIRPWPDDDTGRPRPDDDTTKPQGDDTTNPQRTDPRTPPNTPNRPPTPPPTPTFPPGLPPYGPPGGGPGGGPGRGGPGGPGSGAGRGPGAGPGRLGAGIGAGPNEAGARTAAGLNDPHGRGGAAGQGGRGGAGGMGAGAGARGQGGEDEEHTRASFLVEDDPEALFGTDQATAPPVIGE